MTKKPAQKQKTGDVIGLAQSKLRSIATCLGDGLSVEEIEKRFIRTFSVIRGMVLVLSHHSAPEPVLNDLVQTYGPYLFVNEACFFSRAKFALTELMSRYTRDSSYSSKEPDSTPLRYVGQYRRWIRSRLAKYSNANTHLFFSLFQCKRSAQPLSEALIVDAYLKHRKAMMTTDPMDPSILDYAMQQTRGRLKALSKEVVDHDIVRTERIGDKQWKSLSKKERRQRLDSARKRTLRARIEHGQFMKQQTSKSASLQTSRRLGGGASEIAKLLQVDLKETRLTNDLYWFKRAGFELSNDPGSLERVSQLDPEFPIDLEDETPQLIPIYEREQFVSDTDLASRLEDFVQQLANNEIQEFVGEGGDLDAWLFLLTSEELQKKSIGPAIVGSSPMRDYAIEHRISLDSHGHHELFDMTYDHLRSVSSPVVRRFEPVFYDRWLNDFWKNNDNTFEQIGEEMLTGPPSGDRVREELDSAYAFTARNFLQSNEGRPLSEPVRSLSCRVASVLEPLKVRLVTAGPAYLYYISGLFQKRIHSAMRKMPCFRLIGRPVTPTDISDIAYSDGKERQWFSADYKSSTDCISRSASKLVLDTLLKDVKNESLHEAFNACLANHVVFYPPGDVHDHETLLNVQKHLLSIGYPTDKEPFRYQGATYMNFTFREEKDEVSNSDDDEKEVVACRVFRHRKDGSVRVTLPPVLQVNAQLMGSRMSFPILCLVNLMLYLTAMRIAHEHEDYIMNLLLDGRLALDIPEILERDAERTFGRDEARSASSHVLINGDDLLTAMTHHEMIVFRNLSVFFGLEMSLGKTYFHPRYANINSTSFDMLCTSTLPNRRVTENRFLNVGLFFGQNKVLSGSEIEKSQDENLTPHIAVLPAVMAGCFHKQAGIVGSYLSLHKEALRSEARGRNLFISRSLGGFGVPVPTADRPFDFSVTPQQYSEASIRLSRMKDPQPDQLPSLIRRREIDDSIIQPWRYDEALITSTRITRRTDIRLPRDIDLTVEYRDAASDVLPPNVPEFVDLQSDCDEPKALELVYDEADIEELEILRSQIRFIVEMRFGETPVRP